MQQLLVHAKAFEDKEGTWYLAIMIRGAGLVPFS